MALAPLGAFARSHPTPTPTATPSLPPEDPAVTAIARREFVAWQAGSVNPEHYATLSRASITPEKVNQTAQGLGLKGSFISAEWMGPIVIQDPPPGVSGYLYKMHCSNGDVFEELMLQADGKVAGIIFKDKLT